MYAELRVQQLWCWLVRGSCASRYRTVRMTGAWMVGTLPARQYAPFMAPLPLHTTYTHDPPAPMHPLLLLLTPLPFQSCLHEVVYPAHITIPMSIVFVRTAVQEPRRDNGDNDRPNVKKIREVFRKGKIILKEPAKLIT